MAVVIKGLPADHPLSKCMGEYVEQAEQHNARPWFWGGRCNDMRLSFSNSLGWQVQGDYEGGSATFLYALGTETLPHLVTCGWVVCGMRKDPSSVRVEKFKKRETMLKLSGGQGFRYGALCEGIYRKQDRIHDGKPTYVYKNHAIWFQEGFGWCVGIEESIGTRRCMMHADDFSPTPDAVQSGWMVLADAVKDSRVQVVLASAECTPSPLGQQQMPIPVSANIPDPSSEQELRSAPETTPPPPMIAVVGVGEGFSGLYKKQQHMYGGKVLYKGSRADGSRVIFYYYPSNPRQSDRFEPGWRIGSVGSNGNFGSSISANSSTASPHTLGAVWQECGTEPCSARVTMSKKKHTNVIEAKGVPADHAVCAQTANGKYRQQALKIDGRPTFKGGHSGNQAIWYSESAGSWRIGRVAFVGTAAYYMHAKDTASLPNAVKSTWEILNGLYEPTPYAKIIVPTVEAAEQEVPRQMQLKMAEVLAAEQRRCLGCGHEYTLQTEVVYHEECMHHHCVCCGEEEGSDACAVCAADDGSDSCAV
jgi:hypothetical protein